MLEGRLWDGMVLVRNNLNNLKEWFLEFDIKTKQNNTNSINKQWELR